jgi:hypothetical protein
MPAGRQRRQAAQPEQELEPVVEASERVLPPGQVLAGVRRLSAV